MNLSGPKIEHLTEALGIKQITTGPLLLELEVKPDDDKMQLHLAGTLGEFTVLANGQFTDLQKLQDIELQVSASGPDIGRIAGLAGIDTVPNDPFNLTGTLRRSGSIVSGEDITISIRKTIFSLDGQFEDFPNPESATATLHIGGPDVGRFKRLLGLPGKLDGPFELEAKIAELESKILELGPGNVMCFIAEPILASGGVIVPPADYNRRCWEVVKKYDIVYIADEVVTAFDKRIQRGRLLVISDDNCAAVDGRCSRGRADRVARRGLVDRRCGHIRRR